MFQRRRWRRLACGLAFTGLLATAVPGRAEDGTSELRTLIEQQRKLLEQQSKQIEEQGRQLERLKQQMESRSVTPAATVNPDAAPVETDAVKKIVADYLKDNPGAGMPPTVQTGYERGKGFIIRSSPDPKYVNLPGGTHVPFELRIKGRLQLDYYRYKVIDDVNHQTGQPLTQNANQPRLADFSALMIKRGNLILEGTAFDPDLHFRVNFNGFTRGVQGLQNNKVIQTSPAGGTAPNAAGVSPIGGGVSVDNTVNLFEAFVFYDIKGGTECTIDGVPGYRPTYTLIAGKMKPFFGLDEFLGNQNLQFVEFSMADLFFDADDDARLMAAGVQVKHLDDRLFVQALVTNGGEGAFLPTTHLDQYPGFIGGVWYDFGGTWDEEKKRWDLFGDSLADIDQSENPVVRVGGCVNLVPMDRRSLYGDGEQARLFVMPAGLGGTRLINLLNGDAGMPPGSHAVDKFDAYSYNAFVAAKYQGLSVSNEWWFRDLNNFRTTANGRGDILYLDTLGPGGAARTALFPPNQGLFDYGMNVAVGYFVVPKKVEVAARWAWVRGQSGDINGDGTFQTVTVPGVSAPVQVVNGAFHNYHEANEYTLGFNYYLNRQLLKWQTDVGYYRGGNPVGTAGQSLGGFISGADGYLVRTQFQLAF